MRISASSISTSSSRTQRSLPASTPQIFKTVLHEQPLQSGLRYFVLLGDLPANVFRFEDNNGIIVELRVAN